MSKKLIERVPQKSTVNVYYPGSKNCTGNTSCDANTQIASCNGCDWHFADMSCKDGCPQQPICSEIDNDVCPVLGSNIEFKWLDSDGVCLKDPSKNPLVECTYDPKTFKYSDVQKYQQYFCDDDCTDNSNYNEILMPTFCFWDSNPEECPKIPGTDESWGECPQILSNLTGVTEGTAGSDCTNWSNRNQEVANSLMSKYCHHNTSGVCGCINRTESPIYNYIKSHTSLNPSLWYKPCANPQSYLVPTTLIGKSSAANSTIGCDEINNIIKNFPTNLTKSQLQAELNCNITATPSSVVNPPIVVGTSSSSASSSSTFLWIFVAFIILLIVIILILFVVMS